MSLEEAPPALAAAITLFSDQIARLTEQVAALAAQVNCQQPQVREYHRRRESRSCFKCGRVGHIARDCQRQGKDNDVRLGQRASHKNEGLDQITVAAVRSKIITIRGQIGGSLQEDLLDSGSAVSLLRQDILKQATGIERTESKLDLHLVTAARENLPIVDQVSTSVKLGDLERRHNFLVMTSLITPAILGTDFLQKHRLVIFLPLQLQ